MSLTSLAVDRVMLSKVLAPSIRGVASGLNLHIRSNKLLTKAPDSVSIGYWDLI